MGNLTRPNPIVQYREEQARLRLREEQLNRREEELLAARVRGELNQHGELSTQTGSGLIRPY